MRNPLPLVALLYAGGLVMAHHIPGPPVWLLAVTLGVGGVAVACASLRKRILLVLVPMVGWTNLSVQTALLSPHDLRTMVGSNAAYVTIQGILMEAPIVRISERGHRVTQRSSAEIRVRAVRRDTEWAPAFGRVNASTRGVLSNDFFSGREVEVTGVIQRPREPIAPGQFNYRAYLESRGVFYQVQCESANDWQIIVKGKDDSPPLTDRFSRWAQGVMRKGLPAEDESLRLLWAMVLGQKTGLTPEVAEVFMQSGTLHIFAISGLHIAKSI